MRLTYKYRIAANKATLSKAERWLDLCRLVYNSALAQRIMWYRQGKRPISEYNQMHQLVEAKTELPELKEVSSQTIREPINRLDLAFNAFFRRIKQGDKAGFPRFKGKNRYDSFTFPDNGYKLEGKYLIISKLGTFKLKLSRPIQGEVKSLTIRKSQSNKWYACFSCDIPIKPLPATNKAIGIDMGLTAFATDNAGNKVEYPRYVRTSEKLLRMRQRRLARRVKGSHRRAKARLLVAKAHETVLNRRNNWLHHIANSYIANYGKIAVEDLNIKGMVHNRHLSKSISDSSWGKFFEYLSYKAEYAGREIIKVKAHGTSQLCSICGNKVVKSLAVRIHRCPYCGLTMDRDMNAARNILSLAGLASHALTPALAGVA